MSTIQQRVRQVLGADFDCTSRYIAGRGGESLIYVSTLKQGANMIDVLSATFEHWKLVRKDDSHEYVTHFWIVRSKKGILRGMVFYNDGSTYLGVGRMSEEQEVASMHEYNRKYVGYGKDVKVVSYEKIDQG